MFQLRLKSFLRWVVEHLFFWGTLSVIYATAAAYLLEPFFEKLLQFPLTIPEVMGAILGLLFIPAVLDQTGKNMAFPFFRSTGLSSPSWSYFHQEFRKGSNWFGLLFVMIGLVLGLHQKWLWIFLFQFPIQRSLFSLYQWGALFRIHYPDTAGKKVMWSFLNTRLVEFLIVWTSTGILMLVTHSDSLFYDWIMGLGIGISMILGASSLLLEGDSAIPGMSHLILLTFGTLSGVLFVLFPWFLAFLIYFFITRTQKVQNRLKTAEVLHEDTLIP